MKMLQPHDKAIHIAQTWRENILNWYKKHGRVYLPWRNLSGKNAPYGVYVSEIMLQQTQVKRVLEHYYMPFMTAFPTLTSLANAQEESLLKLWEGLGYYTRVRNMQKSARICCQRFNNTLPHTYAELISLPGIGAYSAGAILCFGLKQNVAFVDGNIRRVFCRIFALSSPTQKSLEELAWILLEPKYSFDYNQALLDIGAMICTPKSPSCLICPLQQLCEGQITPELYPTPKKSQLQPLHLHLALCISQNINNKTKIGLLRSTQNLYRGLYNLPRLSEEEAKTYGTKCGEYKHHYTKYAITATIYHISFEDLIHISTYQKKEEITFFTLQDLQNKPLSSLCKKALVCAQIH